MPEVQQDQQVTQLKKNKKYFSLSIGMRLSLAFMIIILLTALIGVLAIQQFSTLTRTTTELNTLDLPEAIILIHLRSLLVREYDLEVSLTTGNTLDVDPATLSSTSTPPSTQATPDILATQYSDEVPVNVSSGIGGSPTTTAGDGQHNQNQLLLANLQNVLKDITKDRSQLLTLEQNSTQNNLHLKDMSLVGKVTDGLLQTDSYSKQIQSHIVGKQLALAIQIEQGLQIPMLLSVINGVTQLGNLEQDEASVEATNAQQESGLATLLIFALTALCLVLSIMLAFLITRSLTRPLKVLLSTTEAIAAGDLSAEERQVERTDEIGRLATAYDKMRMSLRTTIASLKLERQQTQAIIDTTADGVLLLDAEYKILKSNPAVERLTGWSHDEAVGRYCWEILGGHGLSREDAELHEPFQSLLTTLKTTSEPTYLEMPTTARNGQRLWLAVSSAPMPIDEQTTCQQTVVDLHDISQLKAVDQLKTDFVSMVSHELRAPLTTVSSSVEMLSLLDAKADLESYHEVIDILDQQTRRLRQVIEEVLQLTRFDAGHLEARLEPTLLAEFIRGVAERVRIEWTSSDHWIILHEPKQDVQVWADRGLLEIVFRNLFDNARKYSPQGTPVEVEIERKETTGQVQIRIIDHGQGIPTDQLEHIFERFSRGTRSSYHWTRGYGLGLYIVRELLRAHNGTIRAEQHPEGGACFVLSLWAVIDDPLLFESPTPENSSVN